MKYIHLIAAVYIAMISTTHAADPVKSTITDEVAKHSEEQVVSYLSGAAFITKDIDASVDFYTDYLGLIEKKRIELDNDGTRAVFGLEAGETVIYAALAPINFSKERADFTGVNFTQINGPAATAFVNTKTRKPMFGEPIMAFSVTQLEKIYDKMKSNGVTIIDPLKTSPTGKSMTLTVLDPNGVRVQMYEIFTTKNALE